MPPGEPLTPTRPIYAEHTLDEAWSVGEHLERSSRAMTRGVALTGHAPLASSIDATTDLSSPQAIDAGERLVSVGLLESHRDAALDQLARIAASQPLSVRIVLSHRIDSQRETLMTVIRVETAGEESSRLALLTTPNHLSEDVEMLVNLADRPIELERSRLDSLPLVWASGTGGVLLHESAGHPAGIAPPVRWPVWFRVVDDPGTRAFDLPMSDLTALPRADLLASERPSSHRRASFRDHPMPRMSTLIASAAGAPFSLPERYVAIELAEGGSWDPLTDEVRVNVLSASLVGRNRRQRLAPFEIIAGRDQVARSITGARGEPVRYPGVLCSEHGQRLPVGTWCPDLITEGL